MSDNSPFALPTEADLHVQLADVARIPIEEALKRAGRIRRLGITSLPPTRSWSRVCSRLRGRSAARMGADARPNGLGG